MNMFAREWGGVGHEDSGKAEFQSFTLLNECSASIILSVLLKHARALVKYGLTLPEGPDVMLSPENAFPMGSRFAELKTDFIVWLVTQNSSRKAMELGEGGKAASSFMTMLPTTSQLNLD